MASVVAQDTAELRLTLPVERASSSPFPSPGSPFYPPPRLGAHEFASRPSSSKSLNGSRDDPDDKHQDKMPHRDGAVTPTGTLSPPPLSVSMSAMSPTTPTPGSVFQIKTPTAQITMPDLPPHSDTPISLSAAAAAALSNTSNRDSLTSSRPAPPSPVVSRRASAALSRHSSSAKSRRQSKASSFSPLPLHEPEPSTSSATTVLPPPSPAPQQLKPRILFFKIRDFGFPPTDERHTGGGPDAPRANRPRRRWSTYSAASASSVGSSRGEEDEDESPGGWGRYQWNTLSSRFSWGSAEDGAQQDNGRPSQSDLDKNFGVSSPTEDDDDADYGYEDSQEETLIPGVYRALYAFEPEGTAEMALEEEQIVHVVGRGGGVGWAVVEREEGGHALVPESYLELVEAD
ncbi:hypothetical protein V8D89_016167 [Ganoderma adspersum]